MPTPLSHIQKRELSLLARRAYRALGAETDGLTEPDWRRHQVAAATGKYGLRCCSQSDYQDVRAHFLHLLGRDDQALNAHLASQSQPWRVAVWKLKQACTAIGKPFSYATQIGRSIWKCDLEQASPTQIWNLVFELKRRHRK